MDTSIYKWDLIVKLLLKTLQITNITLIYSNFFMYTKKCGVVLTQFLVKYGQTQKLD